MLWGTAPLVSGLVVYAVGPRISRNVAQQVRTYAFFPVAFGKEFQQTHLLAPGSVRQPHPAVFSLHLTHIPQCHRIVCRSIGRTPPVEFISERTRGGRGIGRKSGGGQIGDRFLPRLVEAQLRFGSERFLRRRTPHIYTCRSQSRRTDKHIFHFKSY